MSLRLLALGVALAACTPALDWREVRPSGIGVVALFPCKPVREVRRVQLGGQPTEMVLHACTADGATWAVSHADVQDPARVTQALDEMAAAAVRNIGAPRSASAPAAVVGMTPNVAAVRLQASGTRPDGRSVDARVAVFAKGTHVFQASVLASRPDAEAAETFLTSVQLP